MKFRFEFDIKKLPTPITHRHKMLLIGSCFTENIGEKLDKYKFTTLQNPNGILFNPVSVAESLTDYIEAKQVSESELFYYNEGWHSWKHHSRFSGLTAAESLAKINNTYNTAHHFIKETDYVFITLGSSWVYTLTEKAANAKPGNVAANNHKAPADWFNRKLMTTEEVLRVLDNVVHRIFLFNPKAKIIFTISPVRHLREGVVENNRSKAVLIQAVHHLVDKFDKLYYFPAYELVIDDLRDYRFYAEDLVHPNYFATQYVWEKMVDACMDEKTKTLMEEIHSINLAFQHKAFNPASAQHKKFLETVLQKTKALQAAHSYLDFTKELNYFTNEMGN
ncbi:MAG TPA: GSCFA domain-containing protein [Flavisolibacter sp.]|nr:GSCFA domain-containing protein [Flavisolibacter sp.]